MKTTLRRRLQHLAGQTVLAGSALLAPMPALAETSNVPTLADSLCARYQTLRTLTCEIRKTTTAGAHTSRMLSRVFYRHPDRIHVENAAPTQRRIVADGTTLYYYEEGQPKGFSKPISELDELWLSSLRNIPATPVEHLLKLKGIPEETIAARPGGPTVRKAYRAPRMCVVLSCDEQERLVRIEFFSDTEMKHLTAQYDYSAFKQVDTGISIPCFHKGILFLTDGQTVTETRHIANLEVNRPIPDKMFDPTTFFGGIDFSNDFGDTVAVPPSLPKTPPNKDMP